MDRIKDHPYMAAAVYFGCKAANQTQYNLYYFSFCFRGQDFGPESTSFLLLLTFYISHDQQVSINKDTAF